ncbi:CS domain protein [Dictyocaulus viviparus]|uniref:CS domain protein n=1 Tax=Dictyocaulus viviparus TaxID=29172 RepID=A0A0D8XP53_DICVI|nr:CS domain protein [Dictyocaulus viviparus]
MADDIALDIEELNSLLAGAKRPMIRKWIESKIETLKTKQHVSVPESPALMSLQKNKVLCTTLPTVKLTSYGWDESDKFVKVYITLQGVQNVDPSNIQHSFTKNGYDIMVSDFGGKNYVVTMKGLRDEIVPESSQIKQKVDMLLVMMKKKTEGKKWEQLTKLEYDEKQKRKPKFDDKSMEDDPQASLMNMMKQMYEEGDDEMKRTIRKAWHEGQSKKNTADISSMSGMDDI